MLYFTHLNEMKKPASFTQSIALLLVLLPFLVVSCQDQPAAEGGSEETVEVESMNDTLNAISDPLVTDIYTADPSAHVFNGKIYIYPSHDIESGVPQDDLGSHFDMKDYHVFSMDSIPGPVTDHGVALDIKDVAWAGRQMWAPDAAEKDGTYYLYFPAKDKDDIFKIGVASSDSPTGPFTPEPTPIEGSYSIDPAVFADTDGSYYLYFGGIWGGQLQRWEGEAYNPQDEYPTGEAPAILPKMAKLSPDMKSLAEEVKEIQIVDKNGDLLKAQDNERRFFEAAWVHKYNDTYYFSYSTGDTHYIAYATGDNPYGPFTYQGVILNPVIGWTNHHSILEFNGKWYLFYHDSTLSGGQTHLRNIKLTELKHRPDGKIETIDPYLN
ncbi:alpha-N-arabinofuranosidase [Flavilitoribacter nigricans DSM 23189 = NBRC 102662]|uniref:Alpha-N-arabinofuranosidase n=2 Tax=Flavilitoribacter TaxID=2762562 RepID=A0A2D0MXJ6_FLAN2|nr:alpha-N-arabinofuranosidase [Flavilitoribacter nigricans DSM 23189 = NBRC 102662]